VRFSDPDMRELFRDQARFVARRLTDEGKGFKYMPRRWLEIGVAAYLDNGRSREAGLAAFAAAQPGSKGMTDWKRQHGASGLRQLERFIANDQQDPESQVALFRTRPRISAFGRHELAVRLDLWLPQRATLRQIWTDERSRLDRRGSTLRIAAICAHARRHVGAPIAAVEVWQLRYRQRRLFPVADLDPFLPRVEATLDWAETQLRRRSA
jgi:hypothetical protein